MRIFVFLLNFIKKIFIKTVHSHIPHAGPPKVSTREIFAACNTVNDDKMLLA